MWLGGRGDEGVLSAGLGGGLGWAIRSLLMCKMHPMV